MDGRAFLPVGLAFTGVALVLVSLHRELLTARVPGGPAVTTGWGRDLNYQERQHGALATGSLPVATAAARYRRAGYLVQTVGAVVIGAASYASLHWLRNPDVYTGLPVAGGTSGEFVLGPEPYLLVVGSLLLVAAGIVAVRPPHAGSNGNAHESVAVVQ